MKTLKKLLELLSPQERKRAYLLLGMILIMAGLDMVGVASILPFIAVLASPEMVEINPIMKTAYQIATSFGVGSIRQFLFALGVLAFVLLFVSLAFKALTTYAQLRFTLMREYSIGKRLIEGYLHQPYSWFLNRHSADLGKTILSEVGTVISYGLTPMMTLITQGSLVIGLLCLLLYVDPVLALSVGVVLGLAYGLIFKASNSFLLKTGQERVIANEKRFTAVSEAFSAVKEVKVGGLEKAYIERFADPAQHFAKQQSAASVVGQLPRFALEAIAFGGMLLVVLFLMANSDNLGKALPIITLYAFAGYRLMPALQQTYSALTQLRYVTAALDALHADLTSLKPAGKLTSDQPLPLKEEIRLDSMSYTYPNAAQPSLKGMSLRIKANTTVGLVGSTGCGKTTTVDVILGLLDPQEGSLLVDGQVIDDHNRRAWQRSLGYVPQQIYLADDTVAANIALGMDPKDISLEAVERAAKIANLHEFVVQDLSEGYQTTIGERGVRLSGGQRQRIGIARALYHNPQVLILDEATSALDNLTEQAVMEAVHNLGKEITIILIAHRLSTVKECDTIFLLDKGELKAQGSFDELMQTSEPFRAMASTNE